MFYDHELHRIHKFGISERPIFEDGTSQRMREQYRLMLQLVNADRITMRNIHREIAGRRRAIELEGDFVEAYVKKYGEEPIGNPNHRYLCHAWHPDKQA